MANNKFFRGKRVLITGGLGFIGSNLAIKLSTLGAELTLLDSLIPNFGGNKFNIKSIKKLVRVVIGDMRDETIINKIVRGKEIIFNLAGTLSHIDSMRNPFVDLDINCRAQLCLLEACRKHNPQVKIIFAGTRNQYGKAMYLPVDEKHVQEPTDINGINSMASEKYHFLYRKIYGIDAISIRMTNTYGPRHQMKHNKQGVLNWFIRLLIAGKKIQLFGDGLQIRDINYVDDVVAALIASAKSKISTGQSYNLGGSPLTLKKFVESAIGILGRGTYELVKFPLERKSIEIGNYVADIAKIREELGWYPETSIEVGLKNTINFYIANKKYYF